MILVTAKKVRTLYRERKVSKAMIDKCANPQCDERLVYLRSGVLYAVDMHRTSAQSATHFFWMCEACSLQYKLHFNDQGVPDTVPVNTPAPSHNSVTANNRVRCMPINRPYHETSKTIGDAGPELKPQPATPLSPRVGGHRKIYRLPRAEQRTCA